MARLGVEMSPVPFVPELVPVLSAGKHRNPRKGACFMEMASFLAGERWTVHPPFPHPLLVSLPRLVNDALDDEDRPRIAGLVPDVVGLTSQDFAVDVAIATRAAAAALPIAPHTRQHVLAVGLLTARRVAQTVPADPALEALAQRAFHAAPEASVWAERYARTTNVSERTYRRQTAPHTVAYAVEGIALACVDRPADHLVDLLSGTIADVRARVRAAEAQGAEAAAEAQPTEAPAPPPSRAGAHR